MWPQRYLSAERRHTAGDIAQHRDAAVDRAHLTVDMPTHHNIAAIRRHVATDPGVLVNGDALAECDLVLMRALRRAAIADLDQALLEGKIARDADQAWEPETRLGAQTRHSKRRPGQRRNRRREGRQAEECYQPATTRRAWRPRLYVAFTGRRSWRSGEHRD